MSALLVVVNYFIFRLAPPHDVILHGILPNGVILHGIIPNGVILRGIIPNGAILHGKTSSSSPQGFCSQFF